MTARYSIRPKADEDLDKQAWYFAQKGSVALAHRFLIAAHETFALLAQQPLIVRLTAALTCFGWFTAPVI